MVQKVQQTGTQNAPKKKPLGVPLDWSDEDLDQLSQITGSDLKAANALWENKAPARLRTLLNADVQEGGQR
jgi:hypothetical protein